MNPLLPLTVCTGNICRSPVAEFALDRHLGVRGVAVSPRSSGTHGGLPNDPTMVQAAKEYGYDLSDHVSRPVNPIEVSAAHLVLAMDRSHVEYIVAMDPSAWPKTFTLPELVRRGSALPAGTVAETLGDWLVLVGQGRTTDDILSGPDSDNIDDPHGQSVRKHRAAVERIDELSAALADLLITQVAEIARNRQF